MVRNIKRFIAFAVTLCLMLTVVPITAAASDALSVSKTEVCIGDTVTVKFTQPVTQTMSGVTLGLIFDKDAFEIVDIANAPYAAFQPNKTNCNNVGRIAISWTDPTYDANTVLNAGTELLSVTFAVKENASLGEKAFRVAEYIVTGGFDMTTYMPEDITPDIGSTVKTVTVSSFILDMSFISADKYKALKPGTKILAISAEENDTTYTMDDINFYWSSSYKAYLAIVEADVTEENVRSLLTIEDAADADVIGYKGDVNGDGFVGAGDAAIVSELLHDPASDIFTDAMRLEADVSGNVQLNGAYVTVSDAMWILYASVGLVFDVTEPAPTTYTVTFVDYNGAMLKTETVESGKSATAPAVPSRTGYIFTGWDVAFNNVTTNLTVTATYTQITEPTIVIGTATGSAGDEVEIVFNLVNSPELYAMSLKIAFDDTALELVSATSGDAVADFIYTNPSRLKNGSNFMWYANDPATANGIVLKLVFKIKEATAVGNYSITMTCDPSNTYDANDNDVNLDFVNGKIVVTE